MRFKKIGMLIVLFLISHATAGAIRESKSVVTFKGFGEYTVSSIQTIDGMQKRFDSVTNFDGKGIMGGMAAKLFLRSGNTGEILKLNEMNTYSMDHKKKEYRINPIEKIKIDDSTSPGKAKGGSDKEKDSEKSDVRVIRNEFKVTDTGLNKKINNFACQQYTILWLTEWENINTKERGTDSLFTIIWATPMTGEMAKIQEEEMQFNMEYMKKIGMNMDQDTRELLGMNWLSVFKKMNQDQRDELSENDAAVAREMGKIKGYPIVIDGKYYTIRPKAENQGEDENKEQEENAQDVTDMKGMFGGFAKKIATKKEKAPEDDPKINPAFSYYTEILKIEMKPIKADVFSVPSNYKKK
ncbi:MAG: hypothetical protein AB7W47_15570 [Calditrichaceae bacterium]